MSRQELPSAAPNDWSRPFSQVLRDELLSFAEIRSNTATSADPSDVSLDRVIRDAHDARLTGLAFSGGGIRSATFNLGVLQALADLKLLRRFHYLSTVSGGGYIGSWLVAWIQRREGNLKEVAGALQTAWKDQPARTAPEEIRFLRRFSNYLTPKLGWLGADTWTVIAIYLRNMLLNLTALIAVLAFVLMLPRILGVVVFAASSNLAGAWILTLVFCGALTWAGWIIHRNLTEFQRQSPNVSVGNPLDPRDPKVSVLKVPPANEPLHYFCEGEEFTNLLFRMTFRPRKPGAGAVIILRKPKSSGVRSVLSWEILIGGRETGTIRLSDGGRRPLQERRVEGASLDSITSGRVDELTIQAIGDTCTVRLNGQVVNVLRSPVKCPARGRIALQRLDAENDLEIHQVVLRVLPGAVPRISQQGLGIQLQIVVPLFIAGLISTQLLGQSIGLAGVLGLPIGWSDWLDRDQWKLWAVVAAIVSVFAHASGWHKKGRWPRPAQIGRAAWSVASLAIGGAIGGLGLIAFQNALPDEDGTRFWPRLVWAPPAFIVAISIMLIIYVGLRGRGLPDSLREWWSRLGAWMLIYSLLWVALMGLTFYGPFGLHWLVLRFKTGLAALSLGWVVTTLSGLLTAAGPATGQRKSSTWRDGLVAIAPYVFIVGLLAFVAWSVDRALSPAISARLGEHWEAMTSAHLRAGFGDLAREIAQQARAFWRDEIPPVNNFLLLLMLIGTAAVAALLGLRVDINEFSMHMMYRNRLARCYLGASNAGLRNPQAFTGFDPNDDIDLAALNRSDWRKELNGPYPIINCSLNLVGGSELAWQQRKATSFTFTPKYSGYDFPEQPPGFCSNLVEKPRSAYAASRGPLTLATAMAISGAAASPNMGYHSSPAPAFLMTLFNVRLGWWIGNPRHGGGWRKSSPLWSLGRLIVEMFGLTHARGHYVYLSDGGHFENLGIFELVRRRCRFIVACDAEDDHNFEFGGLGNAIEKCRTDLGVSIELDVEAIRQRSAQGLSRWHCAVGRIRYDQTDPEAHAGTLLYIKSSLTGDEPTDVLRYAASRPAFPHETTADQWFGESQFESYRVLGHHALTSAFLAVDEEEKLTCLTTERLFVELAQRWYPPSPPIDAAFGRRGETLKQLYETLRTEPKLRFLSQQIYPEWRALMKGRAGAPSRPPAPGPWLPRGYEEVEAGLYFCNRMIQLMEDVYFDLHLEHEHDHPDNRGWINLFKHWAWSRMFRVAWTISAANSGARFQNFCERVLDLHVGRVKVAEPLRSGGSAVISLNELIDETSTSVSFLLTPVEKAILRSFRERGNLGQGIALRLVEIVPGGPPDEGPGFVAGFVLLRANRSAHQPAQILYFRIRDHLRRMGMGRRGLYTLLDDDLWRRRGSHNLRLIGLDLLPPPIAPPDIEDAASRQLFFDLYRGVQLELDCVVDNMAVVEGFFPGPPGPLQARWMNGDDAVHRGDVEIPSALADLRQEDNEISGQWTFEDGRRSMVVARFESAGRGTRVTVTHAFLANRDVRSAMLRRWRQALNRLSA